MQLASTVDSLRMDQIARLTIKYTDARFDSGYPQLATAMETLHQAVKSEYLLWGQEQTGTINSPAPAKDHSEQRLNQSVSLTRSAA